MKATAPLSPCSLSLASAAIAAFGSNWTHALYALSGILPLSLLLLHPPLLKIRDPFVTATPLISPSYLSSLSHLPSSDEQMYPDQRYFHMDW